MTGIRHATASAVVLDDHDRVLLVHHNKLGQWLYPGGHIDPNEDPAQAAVREVREETGIEVAIVTDPLPTFTGVATLPPPLLITEMDVVDRTLGAHRHIDHVYVCRPVRGELTPQLAEVGGCRWVPVDEIATVDVPVDLPELIRYAAAWAAARRDVQNDDHRGEGDGAGDGAGDGGGGDDGGGDDGVGVFVRAGLR